MFSEMKIAKDVPQTYVDWIKYYLDLTGAYRGFPKGRNISLGHSRSSGRRSLSRKATVGQAYEKDVLLPEPMIPIQVTALNGARLRI